MSLEIINCGYTRNNTGEEYIKNKLSKLYQNSHAILYIQPKLLNNIADFILIDPARGIAILEVKDWDTNYIADINPLHITNFEGIKYSNPSHQLMIYFNLLKSLLLSCKSLYNSFGKFKINVTTKVCMTNLSKTEIKNNYSSFFCSYPIEYLGREELRNLTINEIFNNNFSTISDIELRNIRGVLFPEIKLINPIPIKKNNEIDKMIKVLDLEQEKFAKRIIDGHYMITGVPGSGKTVIMLSRALFLLKQNPNWKILIMTYTKSLASKLRNKLVILQEELNYWGLNSKNIEIINFHKFAMRLIKNQNHSKTKEFWEYELAELALKEAIPYYDAVLIDEYQDFDESWLKLSLAVCKKYNNKENLFLAGDRLQSIYSRKDISWKSLGINIQGRSKLLKLSYRTGKQHINIALEFLQNDPKLSNEISLFYEGVSDIKTQEHGENINFLNEDISSIINKIKELISLGYNPSDILILCPKLFQAQYIYSNLGNLALNSECGKEITGNKLILTTYHSAKGLESKICILTYFDTIQDRKLAYVGMTRASEHLYIHASDFDSHNFANEIKTLVENYKN